MNSHKDLSVCLHCTFQFCNKKSTFVLQKNYKILWKIGSFIKLEAFKFLYSKQEKKYIIRFKDS